LGGPARQRPLLANTAELVGTEDAVQPGFSICSKCHAICDLARPSFASQVYVTRLNHRCRRHYEVAPIRAMACANVHFRTPCTLVLWHGRTRHV
jgi:hypothetical protein